MRRIVLTLGGIVALAAPAQALAKVNTLTVKVLGDSNASVTVKVTVSAKGVASKVGSVSYKNVDYSCLGMDPDAHPERSGKLTGSGKVTSSKEGGKTVYRVYFTDATGGSLSATLNKKGTKLGQGTLRAKFKDAQGTSCEAVGDFNTAK